MKTYRYLEPDDVHVCLWCHQPTAQGPCGCPEGTPTGTVSGGPGHYVTRTEQEILDEYFLYWSGELCRQGKEHLISLQNCIEDWVTVHWAWEVKE